MVDDVDAADGVVDALVAAQLALDDLDRRSPSRFARDPGREVVEHAHLVAALEQRADEVRADEAGAAGDERRRHAANLRDPARRRRRQAPSPSQVTASSGMPATMPTAFQVPAATRMNPAATSPVNDRAPGCPQREPRGR